ncbi:MAG: 50S ribosomal protein L2 [Candidatus Woesearchaeota archaeon]
MGKRLIQQARGKGGPTYRAPAHNYKGIARHRSYDNSVAKGEVIDLLHCSGHSAPLAQIKYDSGEVCLLMAPEGMKVGDSIESGTEAQAEIGNTTSLKNLPEGTIVYNLESSPGDGGKFVRSSGTFARVASRTKQKVLVQLPSKKERAFHPDCRACIGVIAGGGRLEKPLMRAGTAYYKMKAKNKLWPKVSGAAMNAVDHPFGGKRSGRKGRPTIVPKNASPGRKVGMLRPKRSGKNKK